VISVGQPATREIFTVYGMRAPFSCASIIGRVLVLAQIATYPTGASGFQRDRRSVLFDPRYFQAIQRDDVRKPDGVLVERYWRPVNIPALNEARKLAFILGRREAYCAGSGS
jgi:hypothetical protein